MYATPKQIVSLALFRLNMEGEKYAQSRVKVVISRDINLEIREMCILESHFTMDRCFKQ